MSNEDILRTMNSKKTQLEALKMELQSLEEQYEVLVDFSGRCQSRVDSFSESMERRRGRLSRLDGIVGKAKSAMRYKEKMSDLLQGKEYNNATGAIDSLMTSVSNKKNSIMLDMRDTENAIARLQTEIARLQYEYDTYPEEVCADA